MVEPLDVDGVEIRGGPLVLASDAEVDEMQNRLSVAFPAGYREYVTRLGEGVLSGFVRVLPPWRILAELEEHRGMMSAYWFWASAETPFGQEQAMESIQIADTVDGDVIAFYPANRQPIIVLPRNEDRLHARGPDFLETIIWVCTAIGEVGPPHYFEPFDSRLEARASALVQAATREPVHDAVPTAPDPGKTPREVLMAYFDELRAVEEWALAKAGGPEAFSGEFPPFFNDDEGELIALSEAVHARYCTPRLANALRRGSVTVSATPKHDPSAIRVLGERAEPSGRVVIRTAEGTDFVFVHQYTLERSEGEWRISSLRMLGSKKSES